MVVIMRVFFKDKEIFVKFRFFKYLSTNLIFFRILFNLLEIVENKSLLFHVLDRLTQPRARLIG